MIHIYKILTAAAAAALFPLSASAEGLPPRIMNGSFEQPYFYDVFSRYSGAAEAPKVVTNTQSGDDITMRSTSAWMVTSKKTFEQISGNSFYWDTTAYNRRIELVSASDEFGTPTSGVGSYLAVNTSAAHGAQLAELVAEEESSLYQNISTKPGSTLTWSLSHRARANRQTNDTMAVFIGAKQEGLTKSAAAANDIFKQMAMLLYADFDNMQPGMTERAVKLYSTPVQDGMEVTEESVSRVRTDKCSQEWFCWIITSDKPDWREYSDTYRVPAGQNETTLAFTALTSGVSGSSQTSNTGNLIDNVRLGIMHQLMVSAKSGGSGIVRYDGAAVPETVAAGSEPFTVNLAEGTEAVISAVPDEGYSFVGAVTENGIIFADSFEYDADSGAYRLTASMDTSRYFMLLFAKTGCVIYDPNQGSFIGSGKPVGGEGGQLEYSITEDLPLSQHSAPENGGRKFAGWRVFADGSGDEGLFIPAEHRIEYNNNGVFDIYWNDGEEKHISVPTKNDMVLFLAEYKYSVSVNACYIGVDGETQHNDTAGGTAFINGADRVHLHSGESFTVSAMPKPGYEFKGWYYTYDDDETGKVYIIPDTDTEYSSIFSAGADITVHARFVEIAVEPRLFTAAEDEAAAELLAAEGMSEALTGGYGGGKYGNTIATAFSITRDFSGTESLPGGVWTVYLPTNSAFIKIPDGEEDSSVYTNVDLENPVVSDSYGVDHNKGSIYGMQSSAIGRTEMFRLYAGSGSGVVLTDATVKFGLVIDNLYAPNASAGFKITSEKPSGIPALDWDNSIHTEYGSGGYEHDESALGGK